VVEPDQSVTWLKSSRCEAGACVEVASLTDGIGMRDGKVVAGPVLVFGRETWAEFVVGVRAGEFERP